MENDNLKVGLVGYGFAGALHCDALKESPEAGAVFVTDIKEGVRYRSKQEGLKVRRDIHSLLKEKPDVLVIATPPSENLKIAEIVAANEKRPRALLFEKPLALSVSQAEKIKDILRHTGIKAMVGFTGHGFHPEFKRARELLVEQEAIGKIISMREVVHLGGPDLPSEYVSRDYGGIISLCGIHTADHLHYLAAETNWNIRHVCMGNDNWGGEEPDWGAVALSSGDVNAYAEWVWPRESAKEKLELSFRGTNGTLDIRIFDGISLKTIDDGEEETSFHAQKTSVRDRHLPGFVAEQQALFDSIRRDRDVPAPLDYAIEMQRLLEQIRNSAGAGDFCVT